MTDHERIAELANICGALIWVLRGFTEPNTTAAEMRDVLNETEERLARLADVPGGGEEWRDRTRALLTRLTTPSIERNRQRAKI